MGAVNVKTKASICAQVDPSTSLGTGVLGHLSRFGWQVLRRLGEVIDDGQAEAAWQTSLETLVLLGVIKLLTLYSRDLISRNVKK